MLPDLEGIEVGRRLREQGFKTAILFLTAKDATENKVEALRAGGDDYVTKPFSLAEIVARVQAILRRTGGDLPGDVLRFGDLVLDESRHEVFRGETPIELTATEFALLRFFMLNPRRVLTKGQILQNVWHYDFGGNSNVVETYVSYLRKKLDALGPPLIRTVRQAGYMLEAGAASAAGSRCGRGWCSGCSCSRPSGSSPPTSRPTRSLRSFLLDRVDRRSTPTTAASSGSPSRHRRPRLRGPAVDGPGGCSRRRPGRLRPGPHAHRHGRSASRMRRSSRRRGAARRRSCPSDIDVAAPDAGRATAPRLLHRAGRRAAAARYRVRASLEPSSATYC